MSLKMPDHPLKVMFSHSTGSHSCKTINDDSQLNKAPKSAAQFPLRMTVSAAFIAALTLLRSQKFIPASKI
jgi:hypothetical protein